MNESQIESQKLNEAHLPPLQQCSVSGSTVSLDETQTAIMQGKVCPYCKGKTQYVDSAVISIHKERVISQELIDLIEASYTAKRKTLYNNLKSLYHDQTKEVLESCGIPANKRAEELNIDDYIRILERSHKL